MKKAAHFPMVFIFILFVSAFPCKTASAGPASYQTKPAQFDFELYAGVFGGYTLSPDASWEDYDYTYDLDIRDAYIFGVKFGIGFVPPDCISLEFEYSFLQPDADRTVIATAGSDYSAIEGNVTFHNFMFNAIAKYPAEKINPYIGLGMGCSIFDLSITSSQRIDGVSYWGRGSADDAVFAWQLLIGVVIDLHDNLSMDIGYRYFDTSSLDDYYYYDHHYYDHYYYSHHDHDYDPYRHDRTLDYHTGMFTIGVKKRF